MKIGNKEIPEYRLSASLISDLTKIFEKFDKAETELPKISQFLGHKSPRSGTFLYKIAAFRAYGLVDGRGQIAVTDIGEKIAFKKDEASYNESLIKAVTRIPLWNILFEKYTRVNKEIKEDEFWLDLNEQCDLTIDESRKRSTEVLKAYRDDIKLINMKYVLVEKELPIPKDPPKQPNDGHGSESEDGDVLVISYGKYKVTLPNEFPEREDVGEILKSMIDISIKPKQTKSKTKEEQKPFDGHTSDEASRHVTY